MPKYKVFCVRLRRRTNQPTNLRLSQNIILLQNFLMCLGEMLCFIRRLFLRVLSKCEREKELKREHRWVSGFLWVNNFFFLVGSCKSTMLSFLFSSLVNSVNILFDHNQIQHRKAVTIFYKHKYQNYFQNDLSLCRMRKRAGISATR